MGAALVKSGPFIKERKARYIKAEYTPLHVRRRGGGRQRQGDAVRRRADTSLGECEAGVEDTMKLSLGAEADQRIGY